MVMTLIVIALGVQPFMMNDRPPGVAAKQIWSRSQQVSYGDPGTRLRGCCLMAPARSSQYQDSIYLYARARRVSRRRAPIPRIA